MVALGALFSATWIIASNSWMQTPAGAVLDANGVYHPVDWFRIVLNPSFPYRLSHMVCASFVTGAFVVAGVSAYHLWRGRHLAASRAAFSMAMGLALVLVPAQIALGDLHGRNTLIYQPIKLAAIEGLWNSTQGAPMTVLAWPDMKAERNLYAIDVPHLASLYLTHSWDGEVKGLKSAPREDRPNVPLVFFAFRVMAGVGFALLAVALIGAALRARGRLFDSPWFLVITMAATPLGFVAVLAGWTTTEAGRQPWIVYGLLRTAEAAAPVTVGELTISLSIFIILYNILLVAFLWFAVQIALEGPRGHDEDEMRHLRPGLDRSGPTLVGAAPVAAPIAAPGVLTNDIH